MPWKAIELGAFSFLDGLRSNGRFSMEAIFGQVLTFRTLHLETLEAAWHFYLEEAMCRWKSPRVINKHGQEING